MYFTDKVNVNTSFVEEFKFMNPFKYLLFITIISGVILSRLIAQPTHLKFDEIGLEQGLSQATVNAIVQDAQGFMWFGTQDGLNRFDGYTIQIYKHDANDSLSISDNNIWSLISDRNGDLWIGTMRGGLNKYVPAENRFYHYKQEDGNPHSISENYITTLFEDSNGDIWIGTRNKGLNLLNKKNESFKNFTHDEFDTSSISSNTVWAICEDDSKNLWIGTSRGLSKISLSYLEEPSFTTYLINFIDESESNNITALHFNHNGKLWMGGWSGSLFSLDLQKNIAEQIQNKNNSINSKMLKTIRSLYSDKDENLWIASYTSGLLRYNHRTKELNQINPDGAMIIFKDKSGILWIGTFAEGVLQYDWRKNQFQNYNEDPQNTGSLRGKLVSAILEDREGKLWIGTYGMGLNYFDRNRKRIKTFTADLSDEQSISNNKIISLIESRDGSIWIATEGGGVNRFDKSKKIFERYEHNPLDKNTISHNEITAIYEDVNGEIWIGTTINIVDRLNPVTKTLKHYLLGKNDPNKIAGRGIMVFYEGLKSGFWVGTLGGGLYHYLSESDSFKRFIISSNLEDSRNNETVLSIYEDESGTVWFGTYGGGLNRYDPNNKKFKYYTTEDGLPNEVVYGLLPDKSGNLWLSTNKGLSRFDIKEETFKSFDKKDGLLDDEFNQGAYFANHNGELFFGGVTGLTAFFPENIKQNDYIPPIYITNFKVFNETLPIPYPVISEKVELDYVQNFFSFEFAALNYTSPEKNQYAYKLEGFDKDWHKVSAMQRYAGYTNLDPGTYFLHVIGSNNDGVWNEEGVSLTIVIKPPFWMSWWFRSIGVFLVMSLIYMIYNRRIAKLKKEKVLQQEISKQLIERQEDERRRIAQEMHDSLGQDLLFIKNRALLTITKTEDNPIVSEHLNQISDSASKVLKTVREISHNLRPPELDRLGLTETLRSLLQKTRESSLIKVEGEVDEIDGLIPPELEISLIRIVQEALGNIIKHAEARLCEVYITTKNNQITLDISDNGKGFDYNKAQSEKEKSFGIGITGMKERVRILRGIINISSSLVNGTRIEIQIPIQPT